MTAAADPLPSGCRTCGRLELAALDGISRCRRCGTRLRSRAPNSLSRAWAYLVAAAILYLPANLLPVLTTRRLGVAEESDTILEGIVLLWRDGSGLLALLVLLASIVVPLTKLAALAVLFTSVQRRSHAHLHERARLFRLLELVGRWSMLDIFVVAVLVALVHLRSLATMEAGAGAFAFGAVVVLTMLSAQAFDPRLLWDAAGCNERPAAV